ncbi:MAG TPA: SURF1 family cytochrome oxidase biogenesis protein, partial [Ramlibacter sp.]
LRRQPPARRGPPWHWLLAALALLAAATGAWTLWGPMPLAKRLPPFGPEVFRLEEVAKAPDAKSFQHRQVLLRGRFTGQTFVIAGDMAGRSGYYVLAPFAERLKSFVDGSESGFNLMVLEGWVPAGKRDAALGYRPARHDVILQGRLALPSAEVGARVGESGIPLLPLVLLQEPGSEWAEKDIRADFFQRRWPQLYPRDRYIPAQGWGLLAAAAALAALGAWMRPRRRPADGAAFADTVPLVDGELEPPAPAPSFLRRHARVLGALAVVLVVAAGAAALVVRHSMNDFARVADVKIGNTPIAPGTLGRIVFRNDSSQRVRLPLSCWYKASDADAGVKPLFSQVLLLPPKASVEFDPNPEHADELPVIVRGKACEATWNGPFGIVRSAWWVDWTYRKPSRQSWRND